MPHAFWEAVAEIPWWIYLFVMGAFFLAYRSTKPRLVAVKPVIIANGLMMSFLFAAWITVVRISVFQILILLSTLAAGFILGWLHFRFMGIQAARHKPLIRLPGSWFLFVVVLLIIAAKYYFLGYTYTLDMEIIKQGQYHSLISSIVGLIFGMFLGRMFFLYQCLKSGPFFNE